MAGIYIHIPFCKKKCTYCSFHFSTLLKYKDDFVRSLLIELELYDGEYLNNIETIYFGGGTPSLLTSSEIEQI